MRFWRAPHDRAVVAYDEFGAGYPLVLLHAFPLCRQMWAPQAAALAAGRRVITPDLFGFGGSPVPVGGWTVDSMADALAAFLPGIGAADPVVLGGLSMGGYVALAFARRHPDRLRGLILADTRAEADTPEAKASRDKMIALAEETSAATVTDQMIPKLLGDTTRSTRPAVVAEVKRMGAAQAADGLAAALVALRDRPDATPALAAIRVPTLVLVGLEDTATPPDAARTLASAINGAKLVEVPAAGHLSNLESPTAFNSALQEYLRAF
jgi:pimeloyl-ACP methyl ester carboxylesterase